MGCDGVEAEKRSQGGAPGQLARRFRADFLTYLPARLIPAGVGLATVAVFTRLFPPDAYGRYALVLAGGGISLAILAGWLRHCVLRFFPEEERAGRGRSFLLTMVMLAALTAALPLGAVALVLVVPALGERFAPLIPWAGAWVAVGVLYGTLTGFLQAGLKARRYALWEAVRAVLGLAVALGYVFLVHRHIAGVFAGLVVAMLAVGMLVARELGLLGRTRPTFKRERRPERRWVLGLLAYGLPMVGWAVGREILNLSDRFVIQWFLGSEAVGIYASNYFLADGGTALLVLPLLAAVQPLVMHGWAWEGREHVQELVRYATRTMLLLLLPALAVVAVVARQLSGAMLDPAYHAGFLVLPLVLAGDGAWALGQLGHKGLQLARRTTVMLGGVLLCGAVNVGLNVLAVPRWGYLAAAVTTLISYGLYPLFAAWTTRRVLPWRFPWRTLATGSLAAGLVGVFLWGIWSVWLPPLGTRIAVSVLAVPIYVGALMAVGEVRTGELREIWTGLRDALPGGNGDREEERR